MRFLAQKPAFQLPQLSDEDVKLGALEMVDGYLRGKLAIARKKTAEADLDVYYLRYKDSRKDGPGYLRVEWRDDLRFAKHEQEEWRDLMTDLERRQSGLLLALDGACAKATRAARAAAMASSDVSSPESSPES